MFRLAVLTIAISVLLQSSLSVAPMAAFLAQPEPWRYAALGDSLATGMAAGRGYVPRYQEHIRVDQAVEVSLTNLGVNGWMTENLLPALRSDTRFREAVATAHVITWSIGGNDLARARLGYKVRICGGADNQDCLKLTVDIFKRNWDAILAEIVSLRGADALLRSMDIYYPYVGLDAAEDTWPADGGLTDFQVFKPYVDEVNAYIGASLASNSIPYAEVYAAFNGPDGNEDPTAKGYLAADLFHPSDAGHEVIAGLLQQLGY